jgi:acylphosphatase
MKIRAHVIISGRVQGVFFRAAIMEEATEHHVTGWAHNTSDGRLEAVFEGEQENVNKMVEFCRRGPPAAKVTSIEIVKEAYTGEFTDFRPR